MYRLCIVLCGLLPWCMSIVPVSAAGAPHKPEQNWGQYDTAVYVVSTLNLVRTSHGRPLPTVLRSRLGVTRFDVYSDERNPNLYFVQFVRSGGDVAGAVAYEMGWLKPRSVSTATDRFGLRRPSRDIVDAFRSDTKELIGSFTSTLPA